MNNNLINNIKKNRSFEYYIYQVERRRKNGKKQEKKDNREEK